MILELRKQRQARSAASGEDVRHRRNQAEGEEAGQRQAAATAAALAAAAAEKELHPWPAKVGPFDIKDATDLLNDILINNDEIPLLCSKCRKALNY